MWKQAQASKLLLLKYSKDTNISNIYLSKLQVENARSVDSDHYAPCTNLEWTEASAPDTQVPPHGSSKSGLEFVSSTTPLISKKSHVTSYIHDIHIDVNQQLSHLQSLQMQGCWSEWDKLMNVDFSWHKLLHGTSDGVLCFMLSSATNTLPTPDNLRRWGVTRVDGSCPLCHGQSTLRHILTGCPVSLQEGHYTWRHNSMLSTLQNSILASWENREIQSSNTPYITFVKQGQTIPSKPPKRHFLDASVFSGASDWIFLFDLDDSHFSITHCHYLLLP